MLLGVPSPAAATPWGVAVRTAKAEREHRRRNSTGNWSNPSSSKPSGAVSELGGRAFARRRNADTDPLLAPTAIASMNGHRPDEEAESDRYAPPQARTGRLAGTESKGAAASLGAVPQIGGTTAA
jgi:hypothetical protein